MVFVGVVDGASTFPFGTDDARPRGECETLQTHAPIDTFSLRPVRGDPWLITDDLYSNYEI